MEDRKYEIGDKIYIQRPLVLGQIRQLIDLLSGVTIPAGADAYGLIRALGESLPKALAIVLTEEGKSPREKDLREAAIELEFAITPEQTLEVVDHFFDLNAISSLLSRIAETAEKAGERMTKTGSPRSASSSPQETSRSETGSPGTSR